MPAPANDLIGNAVALALPATGISVDLTAATAAVSDPYPLVTSTGASGDPQYSVSQAYNTVWYRFTPGSDINVKLSYSGWVNGSGPAYNEPIIALFTGTPGNLTEVLSWWLPVHVSLEAGVTYYLMVGTWYDGGGSFTLDIATTTAWTHQIPQTAYDVGDLSSLVTLTIDASVLDDYTNRREIWLKYTALPGDTVISIFATGECRPFFYVYHPDEPFVANGDMMGYTPSPLEFNTVPAVQNLPVQLPVEAGKTYVMEIYAIAASVSGASNKNISIELEKPAAQQDTPIEAYGINDDLGGLFPFVIHDPDTGEVLRWVIPFTGGEWGATLPDGTLLVESRFEQDGFGDSTLRMHSGSRLDLQGALVSVPNIGKVNGNIETIRPHMPTNKFYVAADWGDPLTPSSANKTVVFTVTNKGRVGTQTWSFSRSNAQIGQIDIAVNLAETILYYVEVNLTTISSSGIKRWDLTTDSALSDLTAADSNYNWTVMSLIVLGDDTLLAFDVQKTTKVPRVRRYNSSGTLLNTYSFSITDKIAEDSRIVHSPVDDPTAFIIWLKARTTYISSTADNYSRILKIRVSDGAVLKDTGEVTQFEGGGYFGSDDTMAAGGFPVRGKYGHSFSCMIFPLPLAWEQTTPDYIGLTTPARWTPVELHGTEPWSVPGFFRNFKIVVEAPPSQSNDLGKYIVYTVLLDGEDTGLAVTIAGDQTVARNTAAFVGVVAGSRITVRRVKTGSPADSISTHISVEFVGQNGQTGYGYQTIDEPSTTEPSYCAAFGYTAGIGGAWIDNWEMAAHLVATNGTMVRVDVLLENAPGGDPDVNGWIFTVMRDETEHDGTGGTVEATFIITGSAVTGSKTFLLPFTRGQLATVKCTPFGSPAQTRIGLSSQFNAAVLGESLICSSAAGAGEVNEVYGGSFQSFSDPDLLPDPMHARPWANRPWDRVSAPAEVAGSITTFDIKDWEVQLNEAAVSAHQFDMKRAADVADKPSIYIPAGDTEGEDRERTLRVQDEHTWRVQRQQFIGNPGFLG